VTPLYHSTATAAAADDDDDDGDDCDVGDIQVNTPFVELVNQGINHTEGGWPKDVSATDPEQTTRHRRKMEKDEQFAVQMMSLTGVSICLLTYRLRTCMLTYRTPPVLYSFISLN